MLERLLRSILFPREFAIPSEGAGGDVPGLERVWLETSEGRVEAWFLPGTGRSAENPGPAVVFAHGNAELIDHWPVALEPYRRLGVSVWLGEYRGYGRSAGNPSQARISEDFTAMFDALARRDDVDSTRIVFHGRSLGGAVVAQLAAQRRPAAMVLESTFTSVSDFASKFMVPRALVSDPFDTLGLLPTFGDLPILLMHGRQDSVVPVAHAERLRASAANVTFLAMDADHNDFPSDRRLYWETIEAFLRSAAVLPTSGPG